MIAIYSCAAANPGASFLLQSSCAADWTSHQRSWLLPCKVTSMTSFRFVKYPCNLPLKWLQNNKLPNKSCTVTVRKICRELIAIDSKLHEKNSAAFVAEVADSQKSSCSYAVLGNSIAMSFLVEEFQKRACDQNKSKHYIPDPLLNSALNPAPLPHSIHLNLSTNMRCNKQMGGTVEFTNVRSNAVHCPLKNFSSWSTRSH